MAFACITSSNLSVSNTLYLLKLLYISNAFVTAVHRGLLDCKKISYASIVFKRICEIDQHSSILMAWSYVLGSMIISNFVHIGSYDCFSPTFLHGDFCWYVTSWCYLTRTNFYYFL